MSTKPKPSRSERAIRFACFLALLALVMLVWSLFDPGPLTVVVATSIGQAIGTLSFMIYLLVVLVDLWRGRALKDGPVSLRPPVEGGSSPTSSKPKVEEKLEKEAS